MNLQTPATPRLKPAAMAGALLACSLMLAACSNKDKQPPAAATAESASQPAASAASSATSAAASAPAAPASSCLITETSIHAARLGMSYAEFKQAFAATHELVAGDSIKNTAKWEGTVGQDALNGKESLVVFPKQPAGSDPQALYADPRNALVYAFFSDKLSDTALLVEVGTFSPQCKTAEGVGPQQPIKEGLKRYKEFVVDYPRTYVEDQAPTNGLRFTAKPALYFVLDQPLEVHPENGSQQKYAEGDLKPDNVLITEALIHHDLQSDLAKFQVSPEQALAQDRNRPKTCLITATSLDRARLGMTYAELKAAYAGELSSAYSSTVLAPALPPQFQQLSGATGDGIFDLYILLDRGGPLYGLAPPETAKVVGLLSQDERCLTAEGVHTGQAVADAAKVYGKAKPRREDGAPITFEKSPEGLQFNQTDKLVSGISVGEHFEVGY